MMTEPKEDDVEEQNIFTFQDNFPVPDPVYDYPESLHNNSMPLVIDNGTFECRVGWATDSKPRLTFRNLIAKQKSKKSPESLEVQIGNDISNLEVIRWQLKSQFDRNIITQYDSQEQIFDYIFSHLGINTVGSIDHPILLTEAICNPNYCRNKMSELLFECYHVPSVTYGIDAMFSLHKNHPCPETANALVLSCGYNTTHIIPVLDGQVQIQDCRRISIGGQHMESFLQRVLQLKYPGHFAHITLSRAAEIIRKHCKISMDYGTDILNWASEVYYLDNVVKYQLPYTAATSSALVQEAQKEKRLQQIKRLKQLNAKRREEKLAEEQEQLNELMTLHEMYEDEDDETLQCALQQHGISSIEHLQESIAKLSASIQRIRLKIVLEEVESKTIGTDLLGMPDEMLTPDQQEQKRRQRLAKTIASEMPSKKNKPEKKLDLGDLVPEDPEALQDWVKDLRKQRQKILDARVARKQRKADMTKRRTHASQQRMKIITELARGSRKKKEDTFGLNDDDWNVYKEINKDAGDSDSEAEQETIDELETLLREYDPEFKESNDMNKLVDVKEYYRLHIGVEQIRVPELLFQPSMIGLDQAGIAETMAFILSKFSPEDQDRMVQFVFLTGGCASLPNFKERIESELMQMRPFQSSFRVFAADDPSLDAWSGAQQWALSPAFEAYSITRADYDEKGREYLKEHFASNQYVPTPKQAMSSPAKTSPIKGLISASSTASTAPTATSTTTI